MEQALLDFIADFEIWFGKRDDEADDCGFMNGDSDKYKGEDGLEQLSELGRRARDLLKRCYGAHATDQANRAHD